MFDEQSKQNNAPNNLPVEPVDMLASVEHDTEVEKMPDALSSGMLKRKETGMMPQGEGIIQPTAQVETTGSPFKIVGIILVVLVVLGGLGFAAWWWYNNTQSPVVKQPVVEVENNTMNIEPTQIEDQQVVPFDATPIVENLPQTDTDTDGDGLSDARESELGTDINKMDTDNDLLNDGDEVVVWKTDPLNPDTDGDNYPDGTEIKNGYSPTGPGKLIIPGVSTSSTVSTVTTSSTSTSTVSPSL